MLVQHLPFPEWRVGGQKFDRDENEIICFSFFFDFVLWAQQQLL
jgi:hypothetical protein